MIYFDLDGVLRDIHTAANWKPKSWDEKIEGKSIIAWFAAHQSLLRHAPPTEYLPYALSISPVLNIMTTQPKSWQNSMRLWAEDNLKDIFYDITIAKYMGKLALLKPNDILVEDNPNLPDYSQVILIDKEYNRDISIPHTRVHNVEELDVALRRMYNGRF